MCKGEREEWEIDFFSKKRVRDEEGRERERDGESCTCHAAAAAFHWI
jgi:hypothetical protein